MTTRSAQPAPTDTRYDRDDAVDNLNSLLKGEISAAQTYRMALDKVDNDPDNADKLGMLRDLQEDHGHNVQTLRQCVQSLGGEPETSSGAWGSWAKTVEGTMNLFGDKSALKGLKEGEEHGLKQFRDAVNNHHLDPDSQRLVETDFIPGQEQHINRLDELMATAR